MSNYTTFPIPCKNYIKSFNLNLHIYIFDKSLKCFGSCAASSFFVLKTELLRMYFSLKPAIIRKPKLKQFGDFLQSNDGKFYKWQKNLFQMGLNKLLPFFLIRFLAKLFSGCNDNSSIVLKFHQANDGKLAENVSQSQIWSSKLQRVLFHVFWQNCFLMQWECFKLWSYAQYLSKAVEWLVNLLHDLTVEDNKAVNANMWIHITLLWQS